MDSIDFRPATETDSPSVAGAMKALWPEADMEEMRELAAARCSPAAAAPTFVAINSGGELAGFVYLDLRSYAEGCTSSPVPFIEGWWVAPSMRRKGIGRRLIEMAESWAKSRGYHEIASDTEVHNTASQAAHRALGYSPLPALIPFRKMLG